MTDETSTPPVGDNACDPVAARRKAMDYLARREHTRAELQAKLQRAGFDGETAQAAVERLAAEGLQDDARYVESFIQARTAQGKGPVRIRIELREAGIEAGLVEEGLASCRADWDALAADVRRKKFGVGRPGTYKDKARQMRFLQYRGFEMSQIEAAMGGDEP